MSVSAWQPNTYYPPGSFVTPASIGTVTPTPVANGDFELDGASWVADEPAMWSYGAPAATPVTGTLGAFDGTKSARYEQTALPAATLRYLRSSTIVTVTPGKKIRAKGYVHVTGTFSTERSGGIGIEWLDAADASLGIAKGNAFTGDLPGQVDVINKWALSDTGSVAAPAGAAKARVVLIAATSLLGQIVSFDGITWDYAVLDGPSGLFQAVQTNTGRSGANEPAWPTTTGDTVVDNEVTWELVAAVLDSVVWEAKPILKSGATEPTWSLESGGTVLDNTIAWKAVTRRVEDERCPNSKTVAIAASKVWAGDDDIVAFSATVNPLDWSTAEDAGYLPTGLNTYGATPVSAIGLYRSNLVVFNSKGYQMWQVDEDPANHAILDASPVGCTYAKSVQPVSNDLVFLTEEGIRNITIAGASTNLQAGFFGKQIDPLVADLLASGAAPLALFWPGAGQYWLFFGAEAFVLTMNGGKDDMSWSRYVFPAAIDDWTILGNDLILRSGDKIWKVADNALVDDDDGAGGGTSFDGYVAWPFLDFGNLAREKQMHGLDFVVDGTMNLSVGYLQTDFSFATPDFQVDGDTLSGQLIPMPVAGPSFQLRLTFPGGQSSPWEWQATAIYLQDLRSQA